MRRYFFPLLGVLLAGLMALPQDAHAGPIRYDNPEAWTPFFTWEGETLTWTPCRTITYSVDEDTYLPALLVAMKRSRWRSGIKFAPAAPGTPADLDVYFQDSAENPEFVRLNATAYVILDIGQTAPYSYTHGVMHVNKQDLKPMRPWKQKQIFMHELGHVLGLGHVDDPEQIMYGDVLGARRRWNAGDLTGFRTLYPQPC